MRETQNVCIVGPSKRFLSGISYYTINLSNELSKHHNVSVICFRKLLPEVLFPGRNRVGKHVSNLDFQQNVDVFDEMDYNNPITWFKAYRFLKDQKPDYIILQWWTSSVAHMHLLLKIFSKFTNSKIIIEFHEVVDQLEEGILPIRIYSQLMGNLLRRNLDAYISHSESDRNLISKRYGIDKEKIQVIPHGLYDQYGESINHRDAKAKLSINEDFVILSFGLIRKYKGIPYLIQAFESLPENIIQKSRLLIVGEIWEQQEELFNQINSSPYKEKITIINEYVPDEMVPVYFSAANVVVLPYLRASQSGIAHIAMSYGKPVVVSKVGGLKESMADYEGTFFVSPEDTTAIKDEIIKQFDGNKSYTPPDRTWSTVVKRYQELMEKI